MPLYEYQCKQCGERLEKIQSFSAPPETVCPKCGGALERVISAPAIQFKGAGWYVNDYSKAGKSSGSGGGASETKTESKPEGGSAGEIKASADSASAAPSTPAAPASSASGSEGGTKAGS